MKRFCARQGDLLFEEVDAIPASAKKQTPVNGRIILALGEATGHHHSITVSQRDPADWWKEDDAADMGGDQFVTSHKSVTVEHEEHGAVALPPNKTIRVRRQREYSPAALRNVCD